ncbi:uncharacterized protein LOC122278463 isoform X2 [Carya illinoinensis]|uniref:uncharacterized protein LOC122278463 isoform X2 n=1 Tax=Carya illinoinensis TaxID=32201 RepID=UPI001C7279FD|nr:uncharacterized protein LOC122278463 isoform X2 [Carya illinoinensis]
MTLRLFPKISKFPTWATSVIAAFAMPLITLVLAVAAAGPPPSSCTQELVLFSPCLPYISSPPNNLSGTPSDNCCNTLSSSLNSSNNGICLCYLVRESSILGFPVNGTRVLSLPLVCPLTSEDSSNRTGSLESLCSDLRGCSCLFNYRENNIKDNIFLYIIMEQRHRYCLLSGAQQVQGIQILPVQMLIMLHLHWSLGRIHPQHRAHHPSLLRQHP